MLDITVVVDVILSSLRLLYLPSLLPLTTVTREVKFHVNCQDWIPENGGLLVDAGSGAVAGAKAIVPEPLGCCLRCVLGGNVEVPSPLRWAQVRYGIYNIFIYIYMRVEQKVHERGFLCVSLWVCN